MIRSKEREEDLTQKGLVNPSGVEYVKQLELENTHYLEGSFGVEVCYQTVSNQLDEM